MFELGVGIAATLAFPVIAVMVYHRLEGRRNRRAGVRRTQKLSLATRKNQGGDGAE